MAFKRMLPTIEKLLDRAMRPQHWQEVFSITGTPYVPAAQLDLKQLIATGVCDHPEEVGAIAEVAVGENSLQLLLGKLRDGWGAANFATAPVHDGDTVSTLVGTVTNY